MDSLLVPLEHFDYFALEDCSCAVCHQLKEARGEFYRIAEDCRGHHKTCKCVLCKTRAKRRFEYEAALSRFEVFCEGTLYFQDDKDRADKIARLFFVLANDTRPPKWWIKVVQAQPVRATIFTLLSELEG
jgi:hypothetical protein